MMTDRNLRGKSSIIEVVRWLMRGRPSPNLQDDVKTWIHDACLRFDLDGLEHEVRLDCQKRSLWHAEQTLSDDGAPYGARVLQ